MMMNEMIKELRKNKKLQVYEHAWGIKVVHKDTQKEYWLKKASQ